MGNNRKGKGRKRREERRGTPGGEGSSHPEPPCSQAHWGFPQPCPGLPSLASVSPSMVSQTPPALPASRMDPLWVNKALGLVTDVLDEALPFLLQKIVSCSFPPPHPLREGCDPMGQPLDLALTSTMTPSCLPSRGVPWPQPCSTRCWKTCYTSLCVRSSQPRKGLICCPPTVCQELF